MCKHEYTADYKRGPRAMTGPCPYPDLFEAGATGATHGRDGADPALPIDDQGVCIFHSRDLEWKQKNGFGQLFLRLLDLLEADAQRSWWDLCEFVFVGESAGTGSDPAEEAFRLAGRTFPKPVYFMGASFVSPVEIEEVSFAGGASFTQATFERDVRMTDTTFRGFDFIRGHAKGRLVCRRVQFGSYALLDSARFTAQPIKPFVAFYDTRFQGITDFSDAVFDSGGKSTLHVSDVAFEDTVDFSKTVFQCHVSFESVSFADLVDFVDSEFGAVSSAARYRGAAVELNKIELGPNGVLTFKSTDPSQKMFDHDVQISFEGEPAGHVRFENANFNKLTPPTRERLMRLETAGVVEIGPGCIKYRHQTALRSLPVNRGNAPLVIELCQTFSNYFTTSNGINLGFEIVDRTSTEVTFFYFTDEDISEETFLDRLRRTEADLWNLLSVRSTGQLLALESTAGSEAPARPLPARSVKAAVNTIDGLASLLSTFFRVGVRIAVGDWGEEDTKALLGAIRFNEEGADERARHLHAVLVDNYTGRELVGINTRQNQPLPLLTTGDLEPTSPSETVRILFLGANSLASPMELGREVSKIQLNLKIARYRDNLELKQEWAVTTDSLMQAMLDESPAIVHFAGHGQQDGIILRDERGSGKLVSVEALAELFRMFRDSLRCVVLSSCYSKPQAEAIRRYIPHVVGMTTAMPDAAAIAFATGFYKAIGAGREIPAAFDMGRMAIRLEGFAGAAVPVLL